MKHISQYILEITHLQMRLQDQIQQHHAMLVEMGGEPRSIATLANIPKAEDDLLCISVLSAQINNSISAVSSRV